MSDTTLALTIVAPAELWTANAQRRMHWSRRAELTQQWRFCTKLEAMITRTQRMEAALGIGPSPVAVRPDPGPTYDTDVIR